MATEICTPLVDKKLVGTLFSIVKSDKFATTRELDKVYIYCDAGWNLNYYVTNSIYCIRYIPYRWDCDAHKRVLMPTLTGNKTNFFTTQDGCTLERISSCNFHTLYKDVETQSTNAVTSFTFTPEHMYRVMSALKKLKVSYPRLKTDECDKAIFIAGDGAPLSKYNDKGGKVQVLIMPCRF